MQQVLGLDWKIYGTHDPELAIGWLSKNAHVDVLLTDFNLGHYRLDGLDVIEAFHKDSPMTCRLLMSGDLSGAMRDRRYRFGPEKCFEKPSAARDICDYLSERGFRDDD